jgi:RimJ/RimL family protein N-acetyltransferase
MATIKDTLSVREIELADVPLIVDYWTNSSDEHLQQMGVDLAKVPDAEQLYKNISTHLHMAVELRQSYCIIWQLRGKPIGHSNTSPTNFGKDAFMHLHLWNSEARHRGIGSELIRLSMKHFFERLQLEDLYSQPYSLNPAPNRALEKAGFEFVKEYVTVPGSLNFEQPVKLWHFSRQRFTEIYNSKA